MLPPRGRRDLKLKITRIKNTVYATCPPPPSSVYTSAMPYTVQVQYTERSVSLTLYNSLARTIYPTYPNSFITAM